MNPVHCRTTFDPIVYGNLSDIVVAGSTAEELDVMLPKSKQFYNRHFVLDMSDEEKKAKRNLNRFGGLGFVDSKKAYYGIYASRTLAMLLPYEPTVRSSPGNNKTPRPSDNAAQWFKSVVVCQVNEQRSSAAACQTWRDVQFAVGGVNVSTTALDAPGTVYLGRKLCVHVTVPHTARLMRRNEVANELLQQEQQFQWNVKNADNNSNDEQRRQEVGLLLTATVHNQHIVQRDEACSISHVVWEQLERDASF